MWRTRGGGQGRKPWTGPPEFGLPPEIETESFRVVRGALTNVVRHAGAQRVEVTVSRRSEQPEQMVQEGGMGFDVAAVRRGSLGIQGRAAPLGGRITIEAGLARSTDGCNLRIPLTTVESSRFA